LREKNAISAPDIKKDKIRSTTINNARIVVVACIPEASNTGLNHSFKKQ